MELKLADDENTSQMVNTINRTIMELKRRIIRKRNVNLTAINRTIMELKQACNRNSYP